MKKECSNEEHSKNVGWIDRMLRQILTFEGEILGKKTRGKCTSFFHNIINAMECVPKFKFYSVIKKTSMYNKTWLEPLEN